MAGHSHWAGIKHKKGLMDAKRGKIFSKLSNLCLKIPSVIWENLYFGSPLNLKNSSILSNLVTV